MYTFYIIKFQSNMAIYKSTILSVAQEKTVPALKNSQSNINKRFFGANSAKFDNLDHRWIIKGLLHSLDYSCKVCE